MKNPFCIETEAEARIEDAKRIKMLQKHLITADPRRKRQIKRVIADIEMAIEGHLPVVTLASKTDFRRYRIKWMQDVKALVRASKGHPVSYITLLPRSMEIQDEELEGFDPEAAQKAFRSCLNRRGIDKCKGWLIAGLHAEYDSTGNVWHIHWHLFVCGDMIKVINGLRTEPDFKTVKSEASRVRITRKPITNIKKLSSYLAQSWWPNRPTFKCVDTGKVKRANRRRLPPKQEVRWLLWMHRREWSDLRLLIGLREIVSGFKMTKL